MLRKSAERLKDLYRDYNEHIRDPSQKDKGLYPELIRPSDPQTPRADCWVLCRKIPSDQTERATRSMLSIYGGVVLGPKQARASGDYWVKFETDEQVEALLSACNDRKPRLCVGRLVVKCFRIRTAPE